MGKLGRRKKSSDFQGNIAIACGTALSIPNGMELNCEDFIAFNCGEFLRAGDYTRINLKNTVILKNSTALPNSALYRWQWPWSR